MSEPASSHGSGFLGMNVELLVGASSMMVLDEDC